MPFDGTEFELKPLVPGRDKELTVVDFLERGYSRVMRGYCGMFFHRRTVFGGHKFCMAGALHCDENNDFFSLDGWPSYRIRKKAEAYLMRETGGRCLVDFGTSPMPWTKYRVRAAYKRALAKAKADMVG
jgi:hypothetical protein